MIAKALAEFSPFIVFGASKSGTTWLQKICDAHPEVRCHFQRQIFPWHRRLRHRHLPAGGVVLDLDRSPFGGVFEDEARERSYFWEERFLVDLPILQSDFVARYVSKASTSQLSHLGALHHRMLRGLAVGLLCDRDDARVYGTKSHTDLELLFRVFPRAKVLQIVRDGRDVCVSKRFHAFRRGTYFHGDEKGRALHWLGGSQLGRRVISYAGRRLPIDGERFFHSVDDAESFLTPQVIDKFAGDWSALVNYGLDFEAQHPNKFLTLRYEELKNDGAEACRRAFEFLEVDASEAIVDHVLEATDFRRLKKNAASGARSFFRSGKQGGWVTHFTPDSHRHFLTVAGRAMRRLGYETNALV